MNKIQKFKNLLKTEKRIYKKLHNGNMSYWEIFLTYIRKNPKKIIESKFDGMHIIYRGNTNDYLVLDEVIVNDCYQLKKLKKDDITSIVDIGGFIGDFAVFASKIFPKANIYIYEPEEDNYNFLQTNTRELKHVTIFKEAVSPKKSLSIVYDTHNTGGHSLKTSKKGKKVKAVGLDTVFTQNHITTLDLLKIDCEGGEYDLFLSNKYDEYFKKTKRITMEYHITKGYSQKDHDKLIIKLKELGFGFKEKRTFNIVGTYNEDTGMIYAWNTKYISKSLL